MLKAKQYKFQVAWYYNIKIKKSGDMVLRKTKAVGHSPKKLDPNWVEPYRVRELLTLEHINKDMEGTTQPYMWSSNNFKGIVSIICYFAF